MKSFTPETQLKRASKWPSAQLLMLIQVTTNKTNLKVIEIIEEKGRNL